MMIWLRLLRFLPWFCGLVLAGSIIGLETPLAHNVEHFVAGFPHWAGYFACGCVLYLIRLHGFNWGYGLLIILSVIFCVRQNQVFTELMIGWYNTGFNEWISVTATLFFFALLAVIALRKTGFIRDPRFYYLGVLTYPLYLVHENIGFMIFNAWHDLMPATLLVGGTVILMLITAWLIHRYAEQPMQAWLKRVLQSSATSDNDHQAKTISAK